MKLKTIYKRFKEIEKIWIRENSRYNPNFYYEKIIDTDLSHGDFIIEFDEFTSKNNFPSFNFYELKQMNDLGYWLIGVYAEDNKTRVSYAGWKARPKPKSFNEQFMKSFNESCPEPYVVLP